MVLVFRILVHLLWKSLTNLVGGWMGTTLLSLAVGSLRKFVAPLIDAGISHTPVKWEGNPTWGDVLTTGGTWIGLFLLSVGVTIYHDHQNVNTRWRAVVNEKNSLKAGWSERDTYISQLQEKLKVRPSEIVRLVQPQDLPIHISTMEYLGADGTIDGKVGKVYVVLGITNKTISPVRVTLNCDQDFQVKPPFIIVSGPEAQHFSMSGGSFNQIDARHFEYSANEPPWTPERPIGFNVFTEFKKTINCSYSQRP